MMERKLRQDSSSLVMATKSTDKFSYRCARIKVNGEILSYDPGKNTKVGCFVMSQCLNKLHSYFEIKIVDGGLACSISIGLVTFQYPLDAQPGWREGSVGFHADDGRLYQRKPLKDGSSSAGKPFGPRCKMGDKMGCGIRKIDDPLLQSDLIFGGPQCKLEVYFTVNGEEIGSTTMVVPDQADGLHPCVGMHSPKEAAQITVIPGSTAPSQDICYDDVMHVDDTEDEWVKVHDVTVNGQVIEYAGNGMNIHDVGLAQAKTALSTRNHYFEIEIIEPGEHCYIAIGLIHKNYPLHRHPGWNIGSIAYHADDGKIFVGRGQGTPFGPRCSRGDIMGCGIQFPFEYVSPLPSSIDGDGPDEDEEDYNYKPAQQDKDFNLAGGVAQYFDLMDEPDPLDLQEDLLESGDEEDFLWPQYGKFDDLLWAPRGGNAEEPMPMDFVLEPGMGRENLERFFEDPLRRGGVGEGFRDRVYMRGAMRGGLRGHHHPIYGGKDKSIMVKVFFTRNGHMIGHKEVTMPKDGFYPAIGMLSPKEKVRVELRPLSG